MHTRWSLGTMEWCSEDINITNFSKILLKFAIVFKIFEFFCPFLSLTIITGQRSFLILADGLHSINPATKNVFEHFLYCEMWKLFYWNFAISVFCYLTMEKNPGSLFSLCWLAFLSFSFSLTFNLSLSLSLLNSFVDAAFQRLLYGVMSSPIALISGPFSQAKANLTKQWLGTDQANCSPVV